ncbi:CHAP domain-containing protein [Frisingicoccus sp.]|uniref:CHAP domain-containing protein n=1 Tax=Frisingicoccus sp. TaxID=1918627 RepID=UPI002EB06AC2|nr:CHAP domain-containing protein [Frisingicoccus sp.]
MNYKKCRFLVLFLSCIMISMTMVMPVNAAATLPDTGFENPMKIVLEEKLIEMLSEEEFETRLTAPTGDNAYYHELNLFYNVGLGMPNCTAYAYGRAYEILGTEPNLSNGNAGRWWWHNIATGAYEYGSEPKLGAVACWDDYNEVSGHVAIVEEINGSRVTISESQYGGEYFCVKEMNADGSDYLTGRRFLGYIYIQ